jgi:hypothetical protein
MRVVESLEAVEVEHQDAEGALESCRRREYLTELHLEVAAVPSAGQAVGQGESLSFLVEPHVLDRNAGLLGKEHQRLEVFRRVGMRQIAPVSRDDREDAIVAVDGNRKDDGQGGLAPSRARPPRRRKQHRRCALGHEADHAFADRNRSLGSIGHAYRARYLETVARRREHPQGCSVCADRIGRGVEDGLEHLIHVVRRPEGVSDTSDRPLQLIARRGQLRVGRAQPIAHLVERDRQTTDLILGSDRDRHIEASLRHRMRGIRELTQLAREQSCEVGGEQGGSHDRDREDRQHLQYELPGEGIDGTGWGR